MNIPIDDNNLEQSLREAFRGRRELSFDTWRSQHGDMLSQLGSLPPSFLSDRRTLMRLSAAMITGAVVAGAIWTSFEGPSAERVFAQAIDHAAKAKTLSADETIAYTSNGHEERIQHRFMFKQPNLERRESLEDGQVRQINITDYGRRRQLIVKPIEKEAWRSDWSNVFAIDPKTGNALPEKLDMSFRDELLSLQAKAVEDLGIVDLAGQKVRLTQSSNAKRVVKVWTDPHTGRPVQVSIAFAKQESTISSIKIDEALSDKLFDLEPEQGYKVLSNKMPTERVGRLYAKVKFLLLQCWHYEDEHKKTFPAQLSDLDLKPEVLQNLVTIPGGGQLVYLRPKFDGDMSKKIVLHEAYENWPAEGIVVGFGDGHAEHIANEELFKKLLNGG